MAAVGGIVRDDRGRILLVLRGNEPDRDTWSLPGGRVESGERSEAAIVREMKEETGLRVRVVAPVGRVERPHPEGGVYVIDDFAVAIVGGELMAASDAQDARWFSVDDLADIPVTPGLLASLHAWGVIDHSTTA